MNVNKRIEKFITKQGLSASIFADTIGVQRSSISHIISGRNKPSSDFLQKMLKAYSKLNAEWLLLGNGSMLKDAEPTTDNARISYNQGDIFADTSVNIPFKSEENVIEKNKSVVKSNILNEPPHYREISKSEDNKVRSEDPPPYGNKTEKKDKRITKIVLFYDDNTFDVYNQP